MQKYILLFVLFIGLSFFTGCGSSDSDDTPSGPGEDEGGVTLMEALKNPKVNDIAGDIGVSTIFVQSRDGSTMVDDVEALDTLYFLSLAGEGQTHIYETDKNINILNDRLVDDFWEGAAPFYPANLPDIDFESAYESVKAVSGDKPIASIGIRYNESPGEPLILGFYLQGVNAGSCDEYDYVVETGEAYRAAYGVACFFDFNSGSSD